MGVASPCLSFLVHKVGPTLVPAARGCPETEVRECVEVVTQLELRQWEPLSCHPFCEAEAGNCNRDGRRQGRQEACGSQASHIAELTAPGGR